MPTGSVSGSYSQPQFQQKMNNLVRLLALRVRSAPNIFGETSSRPVVKLEFPQLSKQGQFEFGSVDTKPQAAEPVRESSVPRPAPPAAPRLFSREEVLATAAAVGSRRPPRTEQQRQQQQTPEEVKRQLLSELLEQQQHRNDPLRAGMAGWTVASLTAATQNPAVYEARAARFAKSPVWAVVKGLVQPKEFKALVDMPKTTGDTIFRAAAHGIPAALAAKYTFGGDTPEERGKRLATSAATTIGGMLLGEHLARSKVFKNFLLGSLAKSTGRLVGGVAGAMLPLLLSESKRRKRQEELMAKVSSKRDLAKIAKAMMKTAAKSRGWSRSDFMAPFLPDMSAGASALGNSLYTRNIGGLAESAIAPMASYLAPKMKSEIDRLTAQIYQSPTLQQRLGRAGTKMTKDIRHGLRLILGGGKRFVENAPSEVRSLISRLRGPSGVSHIGDYGQQMLDFIRRNIPAEDYEQALNTGFQSLSDVAGEAGQQVSSTVSSAVDRLKGLL